VSQMTMRMGGEARKGVRDPREAPRMRRLQCYRRPGEFTPPAEAHMFTD
jgi:hypothetical protein